LDIVLASRSKRCLRAGSEESCERMILIATIRCARVSRARYTSAMSPAPRSSTAQCHSTGTTYGSRPLPISHSVLGRIIAIPWREPIPARTAIPTTTVPIRSNVARLTAPPERGDRTLVPVQEDWIRISTEEYAINTRTFRRHQRTQALSQSVANSSQT
jgi:hypothetical protein